MMMRQKQTLSGAQKQLHDAGVFLCSVSEQLLKSMRRIHTAHSRTKHREPWMLHLWSVAILRLLVSLSTHAERSEMLETACDKKCWVVCIQEGQNMGNEVVKPYKIITKGEVVSSVVTGSLHDNFLLLENKGVTALHWNILCVWCRDCQGYTYSQGSNVALCGLSALRRKSFRIFTQTKPAHTVAVSQRGPSLSFLTSLKNSRPCLRLNLIEGVAGRVKWVAVNV